MTRILALSALLAASVPSVAPARQLSSGKAPVGVTTVEARFEPAEAKPGDTVTWKLTMTLAPDWHVYAARQANPQSTNVTEFTFPATPSLRFTGEVVDPPDEKFAADPEGGEPLRNYEGTVTWERKAVVTPQAAGGPLKFSVGVRYISCNDRRCLPPKEVTTTATLTVVGAAAATGPPAVEPPPATAAPPPNLTAEADGFAGSDQYKKALEGILANLYAQKAPAQSGLWGFILTAMFWGGISLLTPCVFPMIPITVSFFLKQSEKNQTSPLLLAVVYCGTIILVLGAASLTLLGFFTALSVTPAMNVFIGLLFVVLGLSLFGMFELTLPASLTRFTSAREGRGGLLGTVFMALTFTVVSFTCVAPFLGGFSGMAASGQYSLPVLVIGALAFATTFAAPFFLLALFPSLLRSLPQSGGWLHTVKVVMGFFELAAALKFFRTAELIAFREATFFTYDLVLGAWVALSALCGLYLCGVIRIGADDAEHTAVGVPRFLYGLLFVTFGLYLLPGLFGGGPDGGNHRPRGAVFAWVDSFLLPEPHDGVSGELRWSGDLVRALKDARDERERTGRPAHVFIDFTGETCTNCKLNERNVFTRGDIKDLFGRFKLVQLYTDKVPDRLYPPKVRTTLQGTGRQRADAELNRLFQEQAFGDITLPMYVILEPLPDGTIREVDRFTEGKINDVARFAQFLKDPLGASVAAR